MASSLPLPHSHSKTTKDCIIHLLSEEWPLSAKQIHEKIKRTGDKPLSYQAVHKTLNELVDTNIISKEDKDYRLHVNYITHLKKLTEKLDWIYSEKDKAPPKREIDGDNTCFSFYTPLDAGRFLSNIFFQYQNPKSKPCIINARCCYPPTGLSVREIASIFSISSKVKVFCLVKGDTPLDHFFSRFYLPAGFSFRFSVDCVTNHDIFVVGDYVAEIFWPKSVMARWTEMNRKTKSLTQVELKKWFDLCFNKCRQIDIFVTKNPQLADRFRQETAKFFKGEK